jgi:hypothetical protein
VEEPPHGLFNLILQFNPLLIFHRSRRSCRRYDVAGAFLLFNALPSEKRTNAGLVIPREKSTNGLAQPSISQQQAMSAMGMASTTLFGHHQFPTHGVQSYDMILLTIRTALSRYACMHGTMQMQRMILFDSDTIIMM